MHLRNPRERADTSAACEQGAPQLTDVQLPSRHTVLAGLWREENGRGNLRPAQCSQSAVVIPASGGSGRARSLIASLISLSRQVYGHEAPRVSKVFIGDNGLSSEQIQEISEVGRDRHLPICIVNARPSCDHERNAAHARNRAVARLVAESAFNEGLRGDVLFFDDDVAFRTPDSLAALRAQMTQPVRAGSLDFVALGIQTDEVAALTEEVLHDAWSGSTPPSRNVCSTIVRYPPMWNAERQVEFCSMVAFGRESAAKTNALYMRRSVLHKLVAGARDPFIIMPRGSFEDMWLNLTVSRWGAIARAAGVSVLDQVRAQEQELCKQQAKWAHDHTVAANDLAVLNKLASGFTVLDAEEEGFREWKAPAVETQTGVSAHGVLVNPGSLMESVRFIENWQLSAPIRKLICADVDEERFSELLEEFKHVVQSVLRTPEEHRQYRADTGKLFPERRLAVDIDDLPFIRFRPRVKAARLAGNIAGLLDVEAASNAPVTRRVFVGGTREPVWSRGSASGEKLPMR